MKETCDFCRKEGKKVAAVYDGKTIFGLWSFMCEKHFKKLGSGLGIGKGKKLKELL
jgi:hypothetical protein